MTRNTELAWFKSSYSSGTDGNSCVEALGWRCRPGRGQASYPGFPLPSGTMCARNKDRLIV
jgi:hypothetical protein